jgi:hypothetical protein
MNMTRICEREIENLSDITKQAMLRMLNQHIVKKVMHEKNK